MAYLTAEELKTHIYGELVEEITRDDEEITLTAIEAGMAEAKGYLGDYDRTAIFAATESNRNPLLLVFVKDIAVWHLIALSNPNVDLEIRAKRYDSAISWLRGVQNGKITPDLPVRELEGTDEESGVKIKFGSNPKRRQHYS